MLLVCIIHSDLKNRWPLIAEQGDCLCDLVQFIDAASTILIPKQELFVMTQAKGMVKLLPLINHLLDQETEFLISQNTTRKTKCNK